MDLAGIDFSDLGRSNKLINILIDHESLRVYHEYRSVWTLRIGKELVVKHKSHNALDTQSQL